MKVQGLKILATGLLLAMVVLPGHSAPQASATPQAQKPKRIAPSTQVMIDPDDFQVRSAMETAECALGDIDLQAQIADIDELDIEDMPELAQGEAPRVWADEQEAPEAPREPGNSYFFSSDEESGWLGVTIAEITVEKAKALKLPAERGVLITAVQPESPAEKSGLKADDVITELAGQRIEGSVQFRRLVHETPPGRPLALTIWRDGRAQTLSATVATRRTMHHSGHHSGEHFSFSWPSGEMNAPMPPLPPMGEIFAPRTPRLGVDVEDLTGDLGKYFGAPDGEGVLVRDVRSGSPAEKAGIKAGDVIIKVAGERVRSSSDLRAGLREKREGKTVDVVVIRKGAEMTLPVAIEPVAAPEGRRIARRVVVRQVFGVQECPLGKIRAPSPCFKRVGSA